MPKLWQGFVGQPCSSEDLVWAAERTWRWNWDGSERWIENRSKAAAQCIFRAFS